MSIILSVVSTIYLSSLLYENYLLGCPTFMTVCTLFFIRLLTIFTTNTEFLLILENAQYCVILILSLGILVPSETSLILLVLSIIFDINTFNSYKIVLLIFVFQIYCMICRKYGEDILALLLNVLTLLLRQLEVIINKILSEMNQYEN
jgi:hypothetical protein